MTYATILAQLQIGRGNELLLQTVRTLAAAHGARVIGVVVAEHTQRLHEEEYVLVANYMQRGLENARQSYEAAEAEFRNGMQGHADIEWHVGETFQSTADYLAQQACGADLVVVNADQPLRPPMGTRPFDLAELVVRAGRPVLGVPKLSVTAPAFQRGVVLWKDTLESRRAVANALPLLKRSDRVALVEVTDDEAPQQPAQLNAVASWLERHKVPVHPVTLKLAGSVPDTLHVAVEEEAPDYIVAGVFTHTGLRERLFGDVTKDLLRQIDRHILLSH